MLTVRAPASSGNLGAGFDAISLALDLCNEFSVRPSDELIIETHGEGADRLSCGRDNLVFRAIQRTSFVRERPPPPLRLRCESRIPLSRGLGSSSSAIVAGLLLGNRLQDDPLSRDELLVLGTELEGHPDNVVSCLLGGLVANGRRELLRAATDDRLHQPPRAALFPAMPALFEAALEAGALAACLSGAGSTVLALATEGLGRIASALEATAARHANGRATPIVPIRE